jgi:hypothetical protein
MGQGTQPVDQHGEEQAVRSSQGRPAGRLALQQAELLPEQGDLQVLGKLAEAARREQVEQEREELGNE